MNCRFITTALILNISFKVFTKFWFENIRTLQKLFLKRIFSRMLRCELKIELAEYIVHFRAFVVSVMCSRVS